MRYYSSRANVFEVSLLDEDSLHETSKAVLRLLGEKYEVRKYLTLKACIVSNDVALLETIGFSPSEVRMVQGLASWMHDGRVKSQLYVMSNLNDGQCLVFSSPWRYRGDFL